MREIIPYTDEATWLANRSRDLTSTDIAALFGVSPYRTAFELYHVKHGNIAEANEENERTEVGKVLQDAIASLAAKRHGWNLRRMDEYVREKDLRIGSSFDFCEINPLLPSDMVLAGDAPFLAEVKNVDGLEFRRSWTETDYGLEAPAHIELQAQHQMLVSGVHECRIVALVGGNKLHVLNRQFDDIIAQRILDLAAWFWSLKEAPAPDYARDYEVISRLHGYSSAGKVIEATPEVETLMAEYKEASREKEAWDTKRKIAKAKALELIGDAERVEGLSYNLSAKEIGEVEIAAHVRKGHRDFRVTERKA